MPDPKPLSREERRDSQRDTNAWLPRYEATVRELEELLRELLRWQPETELGLGALHPQHRRAVEAGRAAIRKKLGAGEGG